VTLGWEGLYIFRISVLRNKFCSEILHSYELGAVLSPGNWKLNTKGCGFIVVNNSRSFVALSVCLTSSATVNVLFLIRFNSFLLMLRFYFDVLNWSVKRTGFSLSNFIKIPHYSKKIHGSFVRQYG
jgi:hypothetical protein